MSEESKEGPKEEKTMDYEVGYKKPPLHSRFKPGEVHNPLGGSNHARAKFTRMSKQELQSILTKIIKGSVADIRKLVSDPESSAITVMIAALVIKVIKTGDVNAYNTLLDRLIGCVKRDDGSEDQDNRPTIVVTLPSNGNESPGTQYALEDLKKIADDKSGPSSSGNPD